MSFWDRYDAGIQIDAFMRAFRIGMDGLHMLGEGVKQLAALKEQQSSDQRTGIESPCDGVQAAPTDPKPGIYRHYKGNEYVVIGIALHSETSERMVLYHQLHAPRLLWVRPLGMFCEEVVVDGKTVPRFACTTTI
jgi:hypothetical protein